MDIEDLALKPYFDVWQYQKSLLMLRAQEKIQDRLLLVEHPAVFTCGRKAKSETLSHSPIPVYQIERGGEVSFHEPGQLVVYPIFKIRDIIGFLRKLEQILISTLQQHQIKARTRTGQTGVWVADKKIASIGIAVKRWVSYHGLALNINNPFTYTHLIQPCGLPPETMTSMAQVLTTPPLLEDVKHTLIREFEHAWPN